ncbi:hypothetical protein EST38_g1275 [Candolleomyces aberdarensis]|uniref:Uncharacterized protein n=1 Tax=Candolleomyces aberdarensis TaxID=2316362 RepID=A0A4Q2DXV7_9AGAR|nr:hypothetical protein EST38_g1275 [Candolleomyces aberdarensis]
MARSKRPLSPVADKHGSKRLRLQSQEVIIIDDDGVNIPPQTNVERTDDSDIEIIDDPTEIEALQKCKGKQKARIQAVAEIHFTDDPMDGRVQDGETLALITQKDEELAHQLAMEWASEPSPGPEAGLSLRSLCEGQGSSSSATWDDIEIIEAPPKDAAQGATQASKPAPVLTELNAANLEAPDIKLPNPEYRLKAIKKLITINRECPNCDTLISPPRMPATVEPRGRGEHEIPSSIVFLLHLQCPNKQCGAAYCRGCFRSVGCFPKCNKPGTLIICEAVECCADARAIALYEALSAFDREYLADKASAETRAKEMKKQPKASRVKTVGPGGTGYSAGFEDGYDEDYDFDGDEKELFFENEQFADHFAGIGSQVQQAKNHIAQLSMNPPHQAVAGISAGGSKKTSGAGKGKGKAQVGPSLSLGGFGRGSGPIFTSTWGAMPKHIGRGAPRRQASRRKEKEEATTGEATADQKTINAFQLLIELLPAPYSEQPAVYDLLPHPALGALILASFVPTVLAQLLRNDSVVDWIARSSVYHAMLTLLKRMADCELTIPILVGCRPQFSSPGLAALMWNQGQLDWQREEGGEVEMALPLLEHFKKLKKQAETFLQTTRAQLSDGDGDPAFVEGWSLCADIVSAQDNIKRAMGALQQFSADKATDVQASFGFAPCNGGSTSSSAGPTTRSSTRASKGKGKAAEPAIQNPAPDVEKEYSLACEKLSFEYVSLANPDTKSNLGGGLEYSGYNFADQLKQTQNATRNPKDRIHFAKELAVMATSLPPGIWVRVDEVRNDAMPGHGQANLKHPMSINYNRDASLQTVRWAMVDWFKEEHSNGVWRDVIKCHFILRKDQIRKQIDAWAKDDRRMNDYHASLRSSRMSGKTAIGAVYKGFLGLRLPPLPVPSQAPNMDLVAEFDAGMKRVEVWPSEG